jgi:HprK-related kinase A
MTLREICESREIRAFSKQGVTYRSGPFLVHLRSDHYPLLPLLAELYPDTPVYQPPRITHFHLRMPRPHGLRRWQRPQIRFFTDGISPFEPYPLDHALPLLEWGLNWCIALRAHQYLMLHAGVVEKQGKALILPALPGAGKSTLSAALAYRGWRLLSDEFGLVQPQTGEMLPLPRAIPLKNESIGVIRDFAPDAHLGRVYPKTRKGDVAHVAPPPDSLARQREPATPRWILFPRFRSKRPVSIEPNPKSLAFTRLANNAFNYRLLGATGFRALTALVRRCDAYSLEYSDLDEAIARLEELLFN